MMSFDTIKMQRRKRLANKTWIKDSILTQRDHVRKLEFVEINPKNKDKLLEKYKTSFEKDQKKCDKLFEYESKKVVHTVPRFSKAEIARLQELSSGAGYPLNEEELAVMEACRTEAKPPPSPPPSPPSPPSVPCSVDMDASWLSGFV